MIERKRVCVLGEADESAVIWDCLSRLLPVLFNTIEDLAQADGADAIVLVGRPANEVAHAARIAHHCFAICADEQLIPSMGGTISFGTNTVDGRLSGRNLSHAPFLISSSRLAEGGGQVRARCGEVAVWVQRDFAQSKIDLVAVGLPQLRIDEHPFQYLCAGNFIRLLPLVHFLREVVGDDGWQAPPFRACFMFDDPNLHSLSYGFLHFEEVLRRAQHAPFHVTFAMVPLDGWYADPRAAKLFRNYPKQLSLLFHGNDHLRGELAICAGEDGQLRILAQARRRIEKFEQRAGLKVTKAMAPPHGACHGETPGALFSLGFHGAFISPWSLQDWGLDRAGGSSFGLEMTEMMESGLPIAPRFRLSAQCEGAVVIAAFLDQPIVPVGHHDSLSEGPELLTQIAETINSLGDVSWMNPQRILESNYAMAFSGSRLCIRPYSASFQLEVPGGVKSVTLDSPVQAASALTYAVADSAAENTRVIRDREEFAVTEGQRLRFVVDGFGTMDHRRIARPRFSSWAVTRRILCEARDRAWPFVHRVRTWNRPIAGKLQASAKAAASC